MLQSENNLRKELIVILFSLFLTISVTFIVKECKIEKKLIQCCWITFSLLISSLFFRFFLEFLIREIAIFFPYYKLISPIIFWLLLFVVPSYLLIAISIIGILIYIFKNKFLFERDVLLKIFFLSLLYFIIIGSESWNLHRNALPGNFLVSQSGTGKDVTFFSSITSMLKVHNLCSIGIDGVISFPYHYGTYLFLANISYILDLNSIYINNVITPLILLPLALFVMLEVLSIIKILIYQNILNKKCNLTFFDHIIFSALLTTLTNAPFGLPFVANLSFFTSPFQIDSQLLGNIFLLVILVLLLRDKNSCKKTFLFRMFFIFLFHSIVCFIKSPISHLSLVAITYTCFRYSLTRSKFLNKVWFINTSFCILSTIFITTITLTSVVNNEGVFSFDLFSLWIKNIPLREWHWIYISNGFYTFASIVILAYLTKTESIQNFIKNYKNSNFNILEVLFTLTFISISLSGIFGGALSFASTYYIDSTKFLSLIFCSACLSTLFSKVHHKYNNLTNYLLNYSPLRLIAFFSIFFLLITGTGLSLKGWSRTLIQYKESNLTKADQPEIIQKKIDILRTLLNLSKSNVNKHGKCLWIPKSNKLFWNNLASKENEVFLPFWPVALSEIPLIDGYPISNKLNGSFGYEVYGTELFHKRDKNLDEIKSIARRKGFNALVVLWDHERYDTILLDN